MEHTTKSESDKVEIQISVGDNVNDEYKNPVSGKFPIIASLPLPLLLYKKIENNPSVYKKYSSSVEEVMQSIKDCGLNTMITGGTTQQMDLVLDAIKNQGLDLKVILNPTWLMQSVAKSLKILSLYMNKPMVAGWEIMDEPKYYSWGNILYYLNNPDKVSAPASNWEWNELTRGMNTVRSIDLSRMCYFNLAVTDIKYFVGGTADYAQYLDILQTFYRPPVWSYDFYPFVTKTYTNPMAKYCGSDDDRYDEFFQWLDIFNENTKKTGRPFWAYCLCQVHEEGEGVNRVLFPVPSVGMLRFEAFNALAMGAQGIVYWRYGQSNEDFRYSSALDCEESRSGSDNLKFTKTEIWSAMKQVNEEILKYSNIFLGCEVISALRLPVKNTKDYTPNYKTSFPIGCVDDLSGGTKGFLITYIRNSRTYYMVIVNSDPFKSVSYNVRMRSECRGVFHTGVKSSFVYSSSSSYYDRIISRQLEPGDMDIIEWVDTSPSDKASRPQI